MPILGRRITIGLVAIATTLSGVLLPATAAPVNVALATNPGNAPEIAASHVNSYASPPEVLIDGTAGSGRNWNSWGENSGTTVTVSWPYYVDASAASIYLWTDCPSAASCSGAVHLPVGLTVEYYDKASNSFLPAPVTGEAPAVPTPGGSQQHYPMEFSFTEVRTSAIRFAFDNDDAGVGATEVQVFGANTDIMVKEPDPIDPGAPSAFVDAEQVEARTVPGTMPELPDTIWVTQEATQELAEADAALLLNDVPVVWDVSGVEPADYDAVGDTFTVPGTVAEPEGTVEATVTVYNGPLSDSITDIDPVSTLTTAGIAPVFPRTVTAIYDDDSRASGVPATWSAPAPADYDAAEDFGMVDATVADVSYPEYGTFFVVAPSPADAQPVIAIEFQEGTLAPSGWHTKPPTFSITADRGVSGSPITSLQYCIEGCDEAGAGWTDYTFPVTLEQQGEVTVHARATDDGDRTAERQVSQRIDTRAPVTSETHSSAGRDAIITLNATDGVDGGSGVSRTVWSSGPNSNPNSSENVMWGTYNPEEKIQLQLSTTRITYVHFRSEDAAGNLEAVKTVSFQPVTDPGPTATPTPSASATPTPTPSASPTPIQTPSSSPTATPKPTATAKPAVDIYTTPGFHRAGGRSWYTTCEPYSQTKRCRTDIWATKVVQQGNSFANRSGWYFNSLTYLPMKRSTWAGNPLAVTGEFTSAGHQWRTECDTPLSGRNGCRNFIRVTSMAAKFVDGRWEFHRATQWVVNSMVRFS